MLHTDCGQYPAYAVVDVAAVLPAGGAEDEPEVVVYGSFHQQLEVLEHDAYLPAQIGDLPVFQFSQVETADYGIALGHRIFPDNGTDDGGLAAAHFADDVYEFSGHYAHVEIGYHQIAAGADIRMLEKYDGTLCVFFHERVIYLTKIGKLFLHLPQIE